ncbi:hypothetical protein [Streptomyces sp. NPDC091219]|uniref:hypothetical protein n=1 Tax=Streptomyces sp. NPDC091219 TaxID=3155193 RepID=UPI003450D59D
MGASTATAMASTEATTFTTTARPLVPAEPVAGGRSRQVVKKKESAMTADSTDVTTTAE